MNIVTTTFGAAEQDIRLVRNAVFCDEQGIPAELEWDGKDSICMHAVAYEDGIPIGTGRLFPDGKIGRIAVLKAGRGKGVGAAMLVKLISAATSQNIETVYLHAQLQAVSFYEGIGFELKGEPFMEDGIEHVYMERLLG